MKIDHLLIKYRKGNKNNNIVSRLSSGCPLVEVLNVFRKWLSICLTITFSLCEQAKKTNRGTESGQAARMM